MNAQTPMSGPTTPTSAEPGTPPGLPPAQPGGGSRALRVLALAAVCTGVAALAAATFVLSYSALHTVALQAGVAPHLAKGYPLVLDAMLILVLAAVLALRGAGLPSRLLAWVTLLLVLVAAAGADALHAAGHRLPDKPARITAAVLPWALVLIAFALLLLMLRHFRLRRQAAARGKVVPHGGARAHWQPDGRPLPALDLPARPGAAPGVVPGLATPVPVPAAPAPAAMASPTVPLAVTATPAPAAATTAGPDTAEPGPSQPAAAGPDAIGPAPAEPDAAEPAHAAPAGPARSYSIVEPVLSVPRQAGPETAADADPEFASQHTDLAIDAELSPDDPSSDEAASSAAETGPGQAESISPGPSGWGQEPDAGYRIADDGPAADDTTPATEDIAPVQATGPAGEDEDTAPAQDADAEPDDDEAGTTDEAAPAGAAERDAAQTDAGEQEPAADGPSDPDMPVFHRMWSSPTPPSGM
jgi:hypothetical protein